MGELKASCIFSRFCINSHRTTSLPGLWNPSSSSALSCSWGQRKKQWYIVIKQKRRKSNKTGGKNYGMIFDNNLFIYLAMDSIVLNLYLGIVSFSIGTIFLFLILKRIIKSKRKIVPFLVFQFIISFILSLIIWRFWIFDHDIMLGIILLPAAIAEVFTTTIICIIVLWHYRKEGRVNTHG